MRIKSWLRVLAGPIVAGFLAAGARYLGIELTQDQQATAADAVITGLTVGGALVTSKLVSVKANPGNAASPTMAEEFTREREAIKHRETGAYTPVDPRPRDTDYTV